MLAFVLMGKISLADVLQLSVAERIQLAEDIWDTLQDVPEPLQLTDEQREELNRRLEDHRQHPDEGILWDELKVSILTGE